MVAKRIAVIGGGPAGLGTIKCLKEVGIEPVCFERTSHYGGLWRYHEDDVDGLASVMKTTIINTSKEMGALSDCPPPDDVPNYMHNTEIFNCITLYSEKFDLLRHVKFNKETTRIEKTEDYEETGRLSVTTRDTKTGQLSAEIFDGVCVCIGHHVYPNFPTFPGQEKFKGTLLHTHSLKTVEQFTDKVVVVVGVGNSGMDASVETSAVSKQVYLSTRRGTWVYPRVGPRGIPFDMAKSTRIANYLFGLLPFSWACWSMEKAINQNFDHAMYNLKPKHHVFAQHPSVSDTLPIKLLSGTVKVRPNIQEFTEDGVIFEGEKEVTKADAVIFATGYKIKFPFVDEELTTVKNNRVHLYKYIFPPNLPHATFAIIGLIQSVGAGFPIGEAQARWVSLVMRGDLSLPSCKAMEEDIKAKNEANAKRYVDTQRHTIQVNYIPYLDEITELFGAKPNFLKMLFTDPKLFSALMFGPSLPYQYRLQGPYPWDGARDAILTYKKRLIKPLREDYDFRKSQKSKSGVKLLLILSLVIAVFSVIFFR